MDNRTIFWVGTAAAAQQPDTKPNAGWRDGSSLVPSIPAGCAGKCKVDSSIQRRIIYVAKEPATIIFESGPQ